jgi:hydroxypyruvate isomerase
MFRNSAGADVVDQLRWMHEQGFRSLEDNGMRSRSVAEQERIGAELARLGMRMGVFVLNPGTAFNKVTFAAGEEEFRTSFLADVDASIEVANRVNAKWMTVVPGNFDRALTTEYQTSNVIAALRKAVGILEPHGLVMVLEALSDNPDLFLRHSDQAFMICKAVNSPSCKILFDMYHMQRTEGNIINNIDKTWNEIAYFQIGDNPGRNEPTTGEMNYKNIFKHIYNKGFRGVMGMEHGNSKRGKEGELALIKAYRESDDFLT